MATHLTSPTNKPIASSEWTYIADAITAGKVTLFCGAGISADKPSSLPIASQLVDKIQSDYLHRFPKNVRASGLRPEVLFHLISRHDASGLLTKLNLYLGSFCPNTNHEFAATCLAFKNHVITSNFDLLIESACLARGITTNRTTERLPDSVESVLFKIHGSLDQAESISHTINRVYQGLGKSRSETFRKLTERRLIIVIGYSGLDQLDIMPVFWKCRPTRIYWFNHVTSTRACLRRHIVGSYVARLPRIQYFDAATKNVIARLNRCLRPAILRRKRNAKLPKVQRARIAVDILMHENRYARARDLIVENKLRNDLHCAIAHFEASGSISKRTPTWRKKRDQMLDKLFQLPENKQRPFLGTMAKFVDSERRLDQVASSIETQIKTKGKVSESVLEAGVEVVYEYIWRRRYSEAEAWLESLRRITRSSEFLLIEARRCIEEAFFCHDAYCNISNDKQYLRRGIRAANKALFLLGDDMFADAFFFNQARVNKANLLRLKHRFKEALSLYDLAESYFQNVSINSKLFVKYERADLYFRKRDLIRALRELRTFLSESRSAGRRLWLGFVYRLHAQILQQFSHQRRKVPVSKIQRLLERSTNEFRKEGNRAEAEASRSLVATIRSKKRTS